MSITFTVERPVSINATYARGRMRAKQRGFYLTKEGQAFKDRIASAALAARAASAWPSDLGAVKHAVLSYQLYNYRGDADSVRKILRDSCQGILYENDRIVADGQAPLPLKDGGPARVVVTVELLLSPWVTQ